MDKKLNAEENVLAQCIGLENSANVLYHILCSVVTIDDEKHKAQIASHIFAVTVLRALCTERALKLAKRIETGKPWGNIHDLWKLYDNLSESTKEELGNGKYMTRRQIEDTLKNNRHNFNEWRYISEKNSAVSTEFNTMKNATRQIMEWCATELAKNAS